MDSVHKTVVGTSHDDHDAVVGAHCSEGQW